MFLYSWMKTLRHWMMGFFLVDPTASDSPNHPAVNHGYSSAFSFADGHSETKKWQDQFIKPGSTGTNDNQWLSAHSTVLK